MVSMWQMCWWVMWWSVCDWWDVLCSVVQMSKSTGNFLALSEAISKFSADGEYSFSAASCVWISFLSHCLCPLHFSDVRGYFKKNQQTKRVNAWITSNKHSKDVSHLRYFSPGIQVNTRHRSSMKGMFSVFVWLFLYIFICFFKFMFRFCWCKPNRLVGSLEIIFIIGSSNSSSSSRTYQFI